MKNLLLIAAALLISAPALADTHIGQTYCSNVNGSLWSNNLTINGNHGRISDSKNPAWLFEVQGNRALTGDEVSSYNSALHIVLASGEFYSISRSNFGEDLPHGNAIIIGVTTGGSHVLLSSLPGYLGSVEACDEN